MDIEYLLFLQRWREGSGAALIPFFEELSLFAVTYLVLIPVFIYWVLSKKKGLYVLASYYLCCAVNAVVKLTACIYRPWIRSPGRGGQSYGSTPGGAQKGETDETIHAI